MKLYIVIINGTFRVRTSASTPEQAIKQVADFERCPERICTAEEIKCLDT